jgi:tetratricopeptide (TPR) repeat protein
MKLNGLCRLVVACAGALFLLPSTHGTPLVPKREQPAANPSPEQLSKTNIVAEIEYARRFRAEHDSPQAYAVLAGLLTSQAPDSQKQAALLEMALTAIEEDALPKAQQILMQYSQRYSDDPHIPEILLCEGQLYRRMGANRMALAKFYAVMTTVLNLSTDRVADYQRLVAQAQTEIADTYYEQGDFAEASDLLTRLLRQDSRQVDKIQSEFKLIRCLTKLNRHVEVIERAKGFLAQAVNVPEQVEVRFYLIHSLRQAGRTQEALEHLLELLQMKPGKTALDLKSWRSWQQRAGNEIGNQLYVEGDHLGALTVYLSLLQLDDTHTWRFPLLYQVGLIYERLAQPQKASEIYSQIVETKMSPTEKSSLSLKLIADMAQWRINHLAWLAKAELTTRRLRIDTPPALTGAPQTTPKQDPKP